MWVPPFRHLRIIGYLLLPEAFRSLSRLSSALSAKASSLCSLQLNHLRSVLLDFPPRLAWHGRLFSADIFSAVASLFYLFSASVFLPRHAVDVLDT